MAIGLAGPGAGARPRPHRVGRAWLGGSLELLAWLPPRVRGCKLAQCGLLDTVPTIAPGSAMRTRGVCGPPHGTACFG